MKVVEINDNDIYGKVFNGYDIAERFNKEGKFKINQLVIHKFSKAKFVKPLLKNYIGLDYEYVLNKLSNEILSVHSLISITTDYLENNKFYKNADLAHYHQIHNSHLNLTKLLEMAKQKPTIISFHDPWFITGRCVHPDKCLKFQNGCIKCPNLNTLFPFTEDNCNELWKIKKEIFENSDVDVIVPSEYMLNLLHKNPYTKNLNIHLLPFGIEIEKFKFELTKKEAKEKLNIDSNNIVLFFRSSEEKGIKYIIEALKLLNTNKKITLLTCSQQNMLKELEDKYQIIELGNINEQKVKHCYNAADIFLMPSLGESFGMMAIEAMASELPVIVFDNTALPSVTSAPNIGILVKNRDSIDLKEKIEYLINNEEERKKRGKLGKELVKEKYDIIKYENKLKKIYLQAYERQKYKLRVAHSIKYDDINFNDVEVQKLLIKLLDIYKKLLPNDKIPNIFNNMKEIDYMNQKRQIKFSNHNVQNLIIVYNKLIYDKVKKYENKKQYVLNVKKTFIYKLLKKSKYLKKGVSFIRKLKSYDAKYNQLMGEFQQKSKQLEKLQLEISNIKNEQTKKWNENKLINEKLEQKFDYLRKDLNRAEESLYNMYKALEEKLWQLNNDLNMILYKNNLKGLTKKENFEPLVSIIIPAYNASNYLNEAIDSALYQTYKNIEIIVVNDGSNDNDATEKIAKSYGNKIKYIKKSNGGVSSALNLGIKKMKGEYFAWLSHDDLIDNCHIEKLIEFVSYHENDDKIPYTNFKIIDEFGKIDLTKTINSQLFCSDYKMSLTHNLYTLLQGEINGGSVLIPKKAFDITGLFDEQQRITQERDMWSRLIKSYKFINIPYDTASIRLHRSQVTNTAKKVIEQTNEKNLEIISKISEKEILNIETNIEMFCQKIAKHYEINNNNIMCEKVQNLLDKNKE